MVVVVVVVIRYPISISFYKVVTTVAVVVPIVQELCESRGGRPELSVLTNLLVSVDVKNY